MIRGVLPIGPRVGSSWLMHQLHKAGLPVYYDTGWDNILPKEGNPTGYYETIDTNLPFIHNKICKVWPRNQELTIDIERLVVLKRPYLEQVESIKTQSIREAYLFSDGPPDPRRLITNAKKAFANYYKSIPHLVVYTPDLTNRLPEIIEYMRY
jgi:hypothetical protein